MSKLEELVFSGLGILKEVISEKHNIPIEELNDSFDDAEGYCDLELVDAYNQGLKEGEKHIEAWKALAAACDLVMAARMEENEAYDKAEDNHIHDTWVLGKAEHSAEDLAEWRAEWAAADTRLLEAETVLREARAVVRDLGK